MHRFLGAQCQTLIRSYPKARLLGITATPWRLDGRGLGSIFTKMIVIANMQELIGQGFLLPLRIFRPPRGALDLSSVKLAHGDYNNDQLGSVMRQPKLIGDIVEHYQELAHGQRTVVFCTNVSHSQDLTRRFVEVGIAAEHIDGSMSKSKREGVLARLAAGTTKVVNNCDLLVEGWDLPALHCVILARPTKSVTRFLQQVGRSMRPHDSMDYALILDHANCTREHGRPEAFRKWSLEDRTGKERGQRLTPVEPSSCPKCGLYGQRPGQCERCDGLQLFASQILETDDKLVEDTSDPGEIEIDKSPVRDGVLCSRCRENWVFVPDAKRGRVKVTCSRCLAKHGSARSWYRN